MIIILDSRIIFKMDYKDPKTRKEKKGRKYKEVYNQKTVRIYESIMNKGNPTDKNNNKTKK